MTKQELQLACENIYNLVEQPACTGDSTKKDMIERLIRVSLILSAINTEE